MIKALKFIIVALAFVLVIGGDSGESDEAYWMDYFKDVSDADLSNNCTGRVGSFYDGCYTFDCANDMVVMTTLKFCEGQDKELIRRGLPPLPGCHG